MSAVLLEHRLPDGTVHRDWLLARAGPAVLLRAFRVADGIDPALDPAFSAEPMPDHRSVYLDYEGPVSGGRGTVRRLWRLACRLDEHPERMTVTLLAPGAAVQLVGTPAGPGRWLFRRAAFHQPGPGDPLNRAPRG